MMVEGLVKRWSWGAGTIALTLASGLMMGACSDGGGDDTGDDDSSPAAEQPTPTPAPTPFDYSFRVNRLEVGTSAQGVDLDGDGTVDNMLESALDQVAAVLFDEIEAAVCEGTLPGGKQIQSCSTEQLAMLAYVERLIQGALSTEGVSKAINAPVQTGTITYVMEFREQSHLGPVDLLWHTADFFETAYVLKRDLGLQPGTLGSTGSGSFGPGDLTVILGVTDPTTGEQYSAGELVLHAGRTDVTGFDTMTVKPFFTGGGVAMEDLLSLTSLLLDTIQLYVGFSDEDKQAYLESVETRITPWADLDLDGDGTNDSYSIGLVGDSSRALILE